jgi:hypothetical protein
MQRTIFAARRTRTVFSDRRPLRVSGSYSNCLLQVLSYGTQIASCLILIAIFETWKKYFLHGASAAGYAFGQREAHFSAGSD